MFLPPAARLNQRIAGFLQNPSSPSFVFVLDKNFVFVSASSKICGVKSDQVRISVKGCDKIQFCFVFTTWIKLNRMLCSAFSFPLQPKFWFLERWTNIKVWSKYKRYKKDTKTRTMSKPFPSPWLYHCWQHKYENFGEKRKLSKPFLSPWLVVAPWRLQSKVLATRQRQH